MSAKYSWSYKEASKARVYLVPTPVGNLKDITARAVEVLKEADIIAAEDTRNTARLLKSLGIIPKRLVSCYSQNERDTAAKLIGEIKRQNLTLAYVSDAGSPGVSDPGGQLIALAIAAEVAVSALPGPTAFVPALTASGFDSARFTFLGFLPVKDSARSDVLQRYSRAEETLIIYEAPHRLLKTLAALNQIFGPDRRAVLARELSKIHEQFIRGTLQEMLDIEEEYIRGEFVIILEGNLAKESEISEEQAVEKVWELVETGQSVSEACRNVAQLYDLSRNKLYKLVNKNNKPS